ncbi:MAG: pilin [Patescibacteria group bacterium]
MFLSRPKNGHPSFIKGGTKRTLIIFAFVFIFLIAPLSVGAQVDTGLDIAGAETGLTTTDIRTVIGTIINAFFGLLGIVVVSLFIYAGFLYMTARGESQQIEKAKQIMTNAVIGLIIIVLSYAIAVFIIQAITGKNIFTGSEGGFSGPPSSLNYLVGGSSHLLGSGIIEYHYPEPGQNDVARNTNISITFKRPYALSTIFSDYDDKGTFDTADDTTLGGGPLPAELRLNTNNFKIIPNEALEPLEGANPDQRFDARYNSTETLIDPAPIARVTTVADEYNPLDRQTLVIDPAVNLGSATTDITYRVAIRGGDSGVKVWSPDAVDGSPVIENALDMTGGDGGYYWSFTTGTNLDLIPPTITSVVPRTVANPSADARPRNQLLQIYFSESMDATTASGRIGPDGGFNNIEVTARCLDADSCRCWIEGSDCVANYVPIPGEVILSSRYRTAEFVPSAECEGVTMNSCGEPVYCLPRNVEIRVRVKAAGVSATEPPKATDTNGVLDMVGNSMDGNRNGTAQGPAGADYNLNILPGDLSGIGDNVGYRYYIGSEIDLIPPIVLDINPKSSPPEGDDDYPTGPYNVPADAVVEVIWSKVMSASSMRTGMFNELPGASNNGVFVDDSANLALRSREREKKDRSAVCVAEPCDYNELDPPYFYTDLGDGPVEVVSGEQVTRMILRHRDFLSANDLGWSLEETQEHVEYIPVYQPVIGAKIKDVYQNCFYPSDYSTCIEDGRNSCCNRSGVDEDRYTCSF